MCTDWAMKEFSKADEEDRSGLADQNTARAFYAGEFISFLFQSCITAQQTQSHLNT